MAKPTNISSYSEFEKTLSSNSVVVADFYADWCGPCKAIAPVFESLCAEKSKPGQVAFVKVDVDRQQEIARQYNVTAMPTFLIFHKRAVRDTVKGANQGALRSAVNAAVAAAGSTPFSSGGRKLGDDSAPKPSASRWASSATSGTTAPTSWDERIPSGFLGQVTRFVGLYFTTLLTLDPAEAAAQSPFRAHGPRRAR